MSNSVKFVMINPNHGGFSFTSYHDEEGNEVYYQTGVDKHQMPITKRVHFKAGQRQLNILKTQKDLHRRMTYVDFIRNSPFCENSPNAGRKPTFREIDIEKDAVVNNEDKKYKYLATAIAFNAKGKQLKDLAVLFGYKGDNEDLQLQCLLNQSEVNPKALIDAEKAVDTECKVLLTELLDKEILKRRGTIIEWAVEGSKTPPLLVGLDDDEAVAKLMGDKKLKDSLLNQIKIYNKLKG